MRRHIHYEAAFEDFLRSRGWPYVPVDERRKAIFAGSRVKSFDFLVYPPGGRAWLVDIKGRQFPYHAAGGDRYWENWVTQSDLDGLRRWKGVFGTDFEPCLVFAYWLRSEPAQERFPHVHSYGAESYAFLYVSASTYAENARRRSPKWKTVSMPARAFRSLSENVPERGFEAAWLSDAFPAHGHSSDAEPNQPSPTGIV